MISTGWNCELNVILPLVFKHTVCPRVKIRQKFFGNINDIWYIIQYLDIHLFLLWMYFFLNRFWGGFAGLRARHSIWWMQSCCWLSGIGSSDHMVSSSSAVGNSFSSLESISSWGVSSKVRHWQNLWWKGNSSLGYLVVRGKVGQCAPL